MKTETQETKKDIKELRLKQTETTYSNLLDYLWKNNQDLFNEVSKYID